MFTIAQNTIKEFLRNKLLIFIIISACILIGSTFLLSSLALSEWSKIIVDYSLAAMEIFGLVTTLFLASSLIFNEVNKNTILLILSKNPNSWDFLLWKFLWFASLLAIMYIIFALAYFLVCFLNWVDINAFHLVTIFFIYLKLLVLLSIIIFFSTFVSPFLTLIFGLAIYFIAHMTSFVKIYTSFLSQDKNPFSQAIWNLIYYIFPNFQALNMKDFLLSPYLSAYSFPQILSLTLYNILYIVVMILAAMIIFKKKEF